MRERGARHDARTAWGDGFGLPAASRQPRVTLVRLMSTGDRIRVSLIVGPKLPVSSVLGEMLCHCAEAAQREHRRSSA